MIDPTDPAYILEDLFLRHLFMQQHCLITEHPTDLVSKVELYRRYTSFCSLLSFQTLLDFESFCSCIQATPGILSDQSLFVGIRLI